MTFKLCSSADEHNLKVNSIPDLVNYDVKNFFISKISSVPYISINKLPLDNLYNQTLKRTFDIIFSLLVFVLLLSWMIPIIGLLIKLNSKGPIFFIQKRVGRDGKEFKVIKFRTMYENSKFIPYFSCTSALSSPMYLTTNGEVFGFLNSLAACLGLVL